MKIQFVFSQPFESSVSRDGGLLLSPVAFQHKTDLDIFWQAGGGALEQALEEITGLTFKDDLKCYLNSRFSVSDPLCLKVTNKERMENDLVHELIHVLLTQNYETIEDKVTAFYRTLSKEEFLTRVHTIVHAIHQLVAEKLMPEANLRYSQHPAYLRAWALVDEYGAKEVVQLALGVVV